MATTAASTSPSSTSPAKPDQSRRPAVPRPTTAPAKPEKTPALKTPVTVYMLLVKGDYVAHLEGCPAYKTQKKRSDYAGVEGDYIIEGVLNQRDVIMDGWDDQIREQWNEEQDGDDYAAASWAWLNKNGYVGATNFHTCLKGLPQSSKAAASKNSESIKKATKQELATRVALAAAALLAVTFNKQETDPATLEFKNSLLAAFGSEDAARQCVAQWMHGMPVDRDRWYASGLPIPQRSDWADYQPPTSKAESIKEEAKN